MRAFTFRRGGSADLREATRLAFALCLLAPGAARAEDPPAPSDPATAADPAPPVPPAPPVRRVGEVTASATRGEREVLDVPGNVTVIDREEIERSGARTLPELLRRQPGVFVTNLTTNPAGDLLDFRGFNNGGGTGGGLLVLVDGRRANEPDTGSADWALLPLEMVESVEIVRGPASALYGDGAVGGVLQIRTRPVEGPPRAAVRGLYGRYDTGGGSLRAAASVGDVTGGLLVDGLRTDGYRQRSDFDSQDVKASLEGTLLDRVVVGSSGGYHHDDREFPGNLTFAEIDALGRRAASPGATEDRSEVDTWFWDGWVEATLTPDLELRLQPYWWTRQNSARITSIAFGAAAIDAWKDMAGVDFQVRLDRALLGFTNRLVAGASYLHDETERDTGSSFGLFHTEGRRDVAGGFLQEELWLRGDLLLAAGVRYDTARYDLRVGSSSDRPQHHAWSPKASLTWRFLPAASAYFAWARGFRMPTFDEDLSVFGFSPLLDPQRSDAFEVGTKLDSERVTANLSLYWMRVRDEVYVDPASFFTNFNLDRVRHRGIELSGSYRVLPWLSFSAAYTFDDVKILEASSLALDGARMPITPKHRGSVGAQAELPYGFELGANANFVDARNLANDFPRQLSALDWYATLDLWLRLRRELGERFAATLSFAVRNATGERYEDFGARSDLDRNGAPIPPTAFVNPAATRTYEVGVVVELRP